MKTLLLTYIGFLSLFCVGLIYYYEDKIKDFKSAISDYQRALKYAKGGSNADHYTYLQLENSAMLKTLRSVGMDNEALQIQIKKLNAEITQLRNAQPIQYEYTTGYWDPQPRLNTTLNVYNQDELDLEQ